MRVICQYMYFYHRIIMIVIDKNQKQALSLYSQPSLDSVLIYLNMIYFFYCLKSIFEGFTMSFICELIK